jgi:hypothetical protein
MAALDLHTDVGRLCAHHRLRFSTQSASLPLTLELHLPPSWRDSSYSGLSNCTFVTLFNMGNTFAHKRERDEDQTSDVDQQPVGGARKRQKRVQAEVGGSSGDNNNNNSQPARGSTLSGALKRDREPSAHGLENDESDYEPEDRSFKRLRWRGSEADRRNEQEAAKAAPLPPAGQPTGARKQKQKQRAGAAHNAARTANNNYSHKEGGSNALLVHYTPKAVPMQKLYSLFCRRASLREPQYVADEGHYKTMAFFKTPADADVVFEKLEGPTTLDIYGLLQKRVALGPQKEDLVWVRKTNWPWFKPLQ